jgi:hypothetical protein
MSYSVLVDKNKESWLVVETNNVIRVFTNKNSAIDYRSKNKEKVVSVLHRYSDGTMQPLLNWPGESDITNKTMSPQEFEQVYGEFDNLKDYEEDIDFYDLCATGDIPSDIEDQTEEE